MGVKMVKKHQKSAENGDFGRFGEPCLYELELPRIGLLSN